MSNKKSKADRGLYRRDGSPYWWIRYADRNGRIIRETTGTKEKKLAVIHWQHSLLATLGVLNSDDAILEVHIRPHQV